MDLNFSFKCAWGCASHPCFVEEGLEYHIYITWPQFVSTVKYLQNFDNNLFPHLLTSQWQQFVSHSNSHQSDNSLFPQ